MFGCAICGHRSPLCDQCVAFSVSTVGGTAMSRGMRWAEGVAKRLPTKRSPTSWPGFDDSEKVRRLAMKKVQDLTDDPRLRERLARLCVTEAARAWSRRR